LARLLYNMLALTAGSLVTLERQIRRAVEVHECHN